MNAIAFRNADLIVSGDSKFFLSDRTLKITPTCDENDFQATPTNQ